MWWNTHNWSSGAFIPCSCSIINIIQRLFLFLSNNDLVCGQYILHQWMQTLILLIPFRTKLFISPFKFFLCWGEIRADYIGVWISKLLKVISCHIIWAQSLKISFKRQKSIKQNWKTAYPPHKNILKVKLVMPVHCCVTVLQICSKNISSSNI